ncbi:hypothetical protein [Limisphaera sp. 4302-co]|uniref:hypothetical protein n=1 Tax=Limisphaera sp. 4302-co TaxID=3400417 RepID=UPI003C1F610B
MQSDHARTLRAFHRRLAAVFLLRRVLFALALWAFVWGAAVLVLRMAGVPRGIWMAYGAAGCLPVMVGAAWWEWRRLPSLALVRAAYDALRRCGGILMSEERADMRAWYDRLPEARVPKLRWRWRRAAGACLAGWVFLGLTHWIPDRVVRSLQDPRLELGSWVAELQAQTQALAEEQILEAEEARRWQEELERLQRGASGREPARAWEALDHLQQANRDRAREAAEQALRALEELRQAESLAGAIQGAVESGLSGEELASAGRELSGLLRALKSTLSEAGGLPPVELNQGWNLTNRADLEKLLGVLGQCKGGLSNRVARLCKLRLVDGRYLSACQGLCQSTNLAALVAALCRNGGTNGAGENLTCGLPGRGGVSRGRADAPMIWKEATEEDGARFQERVLPPGAGPADLQRVGLSWGAPEEAPADLPVAHGALSGAPAGSGVTRAQVVLPRHREVVQRYFRRDVPGGGGSGP